MKVSGRLRTTGRGRPREIAALRARLSEAEETLKAIESGQVDALVVASKHGPRVYTLEGAEHAYRVLIESMSEGALTVTAGAVILYSNHCFAKMVKHPLQQIMGLSIQRFLSAADYAALQLLLKRAVKSGSKLPVSLNASDGSQVPAQVSIRPLPKYAFQGATFGMVVTDMSEARRSVEMLRDMSHRLAQAQESERGRVAIELTDDVTQTLVVILFRLRALLSRFSAHDSLSRGEVAKVSALLTKTAEQVEGISRKLWPSVLVNLGLEPALRAANEEFVKRTGVPVSLSCVTLDPLPPEEAKLALYRIFEEALRNIEKHATARRVSVHLTQRGVFAHLAIKDDGVGFDQGATQAKGSNGDGFGLIRMRERAEFLGGVLTIKSSPRAGTEIKVRIPL